jgi:selenide, water dikinase
MLPYDDARILVDASTGDDAAVYQIDEHRALVATADFFTPIVDDPFDFGRIAAANALSDIYAMGARPLFALNLVGFPRKLLNEGILEEILRGGAEIAREAGAPILGGHSIDDAEPKYGLSVIGEVDPSKIVRNAGARPGDKLILTKPIGTGIIATALKNDKATPAAIAAAVKSMTTLNRDASEAMIEIGAHAATDVTGFGLLGHLNEMLSASGVGARIHASRVPILDGAPDLVQAGQIPGGTRRNFDDAKPFARFAESIPEWMRMLLCDAQTSGGLLIAVAPDRATALAEALQRRRTPAADVIGEIVAGSGVEVSI